MNKRAHRKESSVIVSPFERVPTEPAAWAINEFAHAQLPDQRHCRRLQIMATAFAKKPTAPIPQACHNLGEAKGAYRFLENERIAPRSIRQAHHEATLERVIAHPFVQAASVFSDSKVDLLVRARHDRKLEDQDRTLWQEVGRQPVAATMTVLVGRRGDQPSRMAKVNVRFCCVHLKAPARKAEQPPISLWAIEADERSPVPKGAAPIHWRLLTSCLVTNAQEAIEKVMWYAQRWQIELTNKVLKSGCQIEQRQLATAERLERVLSLDLVVAWRILALCKAAREIPDDPISNWLPSAQWKALCAYVHRRTRPPKEIPGVHQAVRWIAQLGGFLARKSDGEPGTKTLWRGLQHLEAMTEMWEVFHRSQRRQKCG